METLNISKPILQTSVKNYRDTQPLWTYKLDWQTTKGLKVAFRTLLNACVKLPYDSEKGFLLRDIFQSQHNIFLGSHKKTSADRAIMEFMVHQLYQEGLINHDTCFLLYPSHAPGRVNEVLEKNMPDLAYRFGSYCIKNTLNRWKTTINKSIIRTQGQHHKITFEQEFNSLCLDIKRKIRDKTVILVDDFTTTGLSFESARNLVEKAEVDKLVLCSVGKYTRPYATYSHYDVNKDFDPFSESDKIKPKDFVQSKSSVLVHPNSQNLITEYFRRLSKQ